MSRRPRWSKDLIGEILNPDQLVTAKNDGTFERMHQQLAPELQDVARRHGFDKLLAG